MAKRLTNRLNHKILIRYRSITVDEYKQQIESFEDFGRFWAMVRTTKGSEIHQAGQEQLENHTRFVVRYSKRLSTFFNEQKTGFEIIFKSTTYDVVDIINDDENDVTFTIVAKGRE